MFSYMIVVFGLENLIWDRGYLVGVCCWDTKTLTLYYIDNDQWDFAILF